MVLLVGGASRPAGRNLQGRLRGRGGLSRGAGSLFCGAAAAGRGDSAADPVRHGSLCRVGLSGAIQRLEAKFAKNKGAPVVIRCASRLT